MRGRMCDLPQYELSLHLVTVKLAENRTGDVSDFWFEIQD